MFDIAAALKAASSGQTITIPPGDYGVVSLRRVTFDPPVTLAGKGTRFSSLTLSECKGLRLEDLAVKLEPSASTVSNTAALRIIDSSSLTLSRLMLRGGLAVVGVTADADPAAPRPGDSIIGLPIGRGLTLQNCTDVTVEGCDVGESHKGIVLSKCSRIAIKNNHVHDVRTGTISGEAVSDIEVSGNRLRNSRPWKYGGKGDHGDFIHFWTTALNPQSKGVVIRGNLIDQDEGAPIMGVLLEDNGGGGFVGGEVCDNVILLGNGQGVAVSNFTGQITGNRMFQTEGTAKQGPSILLRPGEGPGQVSVGGSAEISDNVAHDVYGTLAKQAVGGVYGHNTILPPQPAEAGMIAGLRAVWAAGPDITEPSQPPVRDELRELLASRTSAKLEPLKRSGRLIVNFKTPAEGDAALVAVLAVKAH